MSENRNLGKDQNTGRSNEKNERGQQNTGKQNVNRGLGSKDEDLQRRGDRKEIEKTGNKTTGTPGTKGQEDVNLERDASTGARENVNTNTRKDQEEGSAAGRSGSKGREELRREDKPNKGKP